MKGQDRNRAHPKGFFADYITTCERYTFASRYLQGVKSTLNHPCLRKKNESYMGIVRDAKYPKTLIEQAHTYVLSNTVCIESYKR